MAIDRWTISKYNGIKHVLMFPMHQPLKLPYSFSGILFWNTNT